MVYSRIEREKLKQKPEDTVSMQFPWKTNCFMVHTVVNQIPVHLKKNSSFKDKKIKRPLRLFIQLIHKSTAITWI